jgi:predicted aspartyl protease
MGILRIDVEVENPAQPVMRVTLRHVLVDPGAGLSWFPTNILEALEVDRRKIRRLLQSDGSTVERSIGAISIYLLGQWTVDEAVFAEPEDLIILGRRSLAGLNLRVDPVRRKLVDAGPDHGHPL